MYILHTATSSTDQPPEPPRPASLRLLLVGLFYADFGETFTYKEDKIPDTNKTNTATEKVKETQRIMTMNFPSLEAVWCAQTT